MKKNILAILIILTLITICLCGLASCGDKETIVYGKKYIHQYWTRSDSDMQTYYIFQNDGTCIYKYYKRTVQKTSTQQTITIKDYSVQYYYTFADEDKSALVYFYDKLLNDSSTFTNADGATFPLDSDEYRKYCKDNYLVYEYLPEVYSSGLLTVSKNILCSAGTSGYTFYLNEDYIKTIPNFNKAN